MGDVQGWVTFGTRLNTKQLEKQLKQQKSELSKYAKEEEKILSHQSKNDEKLAVMKQKREELDKQRRDATRRAKFETDETTRNFKMKEAMIVYNNEMSKLDAKYANNINLQGQLEQQLDVNRQKQSMLKQEIQQTNESLEQMNKQANFEKMGENIGKVIKKVGRWALAIVGIRTAYQAVKKAISMVSQYNDQIKTDLDYMSYNIAMLLEPVVERIVDILKTIMYYIDYIAQAWFGLEGSIWRSAKDFESANKNANKLKRTMLGFDEVNKLSDTGSQTSPSFDLPSMNGEPVGGLVDMIAKNKDDVLTFLGLLAGALWTVYTPLSMISGLGISIALTVLVTQVLPKLIKYLESLDGSVKENNTTFADFYGWLTWIALAVAGVAVAFASWPVAIGAIIVAILAKLGEYWDKVSKWFKEDVFGWFDKQVKKAQLTMGTMSAWVVELIKTVVEVIVDLLDGIFEGVKDLIDGILLICKGDFKNGLISIFKGIANLLIGILNALGSAINGILYPIRILIVEAGKVTGKNWTMSDIKIPKIPYLATGGIVDAPRRGVNIGGAIAGEAGREGVLPLTNSETMTELGKEIGKWITLNLDITNTIDGRILNNRLETIRNNNSFSRNGV